MSEFNPRVRTALSLDIAGVTLAPKIDEERKTFCIVQYGQTLNGSGEAIQKAAELLKVRVKRVRPDLEFVG